MLAPDEARRFYDRFGSLQDRKGFSEDQALDDFAAHADFGGERAVIEVDCGTGCLASSALDPARGASSLPAASSASLG